MKILILGGSGFIGSNLVDDLRTEHQLTVIDLVKPNYDMQGIEFWQLDAMKPFALSTDKVFDVVINLSGIGIFRRWNRRNRILIRDSRVLSTRHLVDYIGELKIKPRLLVQASAMGFYGDAGDNLLTKEAEQGRGFLASVVGLWENEAMRAEDYGVAVLRVRNAIVLGEGGYLGQLLPLYKWGLGGILGNGEQYMPWIHIKDLVSFYRYVVENINSSDIVHAQVGESVQQKVFSKTLSSVLKRPNFIKVPIGLLEIFYGKVIRELNFSQRTKKNDFFEGNYSELERCLVDLIKK